MLGDAVVGLLGLLLVGVTAHSIVTTTLTLRGGDKLSGSINSAVFRVALQLYRSTGRRRILNGVGVTALLITIAVWTLLIWSGWLLFFLSHSDSIVSSPGDTPASFWSRVYFVGFSLITLGVGDFTPSGALFQVATIIASASGFFLVTLSVTYLLPVVTATVEARQLAAKVFILGTTPREIAQLVRSRPAEFQHGASGMADQILLLADRYFAYPVLHYFPSNRRTGSVAVAIAALDEALTILLSRSGEADPDRQTAALVRATRSALDSYLDLLQGQFLSRGSEKPPIPRAEELEATGIPQGELRDLQLRFEQLDERRMLLHSLVTHDARDWQEVYSAEGPD